MEQISSITDKLFSFKVLRFQISTINPTVRKGGKSTLPLLIISTVWFLRKIVSCYWDICSHFDRRWAPCCPSSRKHFCMHRILNPTAHSSSVLHNVSCLQFQYCCPVFNICRNIRSFYKHKFYLFSSSVKISFLIFLQQECPALFFQKLWKAESLPFARA